MWINANLYDYSSEGINGDTGIRRDISDQMNAKCVELMGEEDVVDEDLDEDIEEGQQFAQEVFDGIPVVRTGSSVQKLHYKCRLPVSEVVFNGEVVEIRHEWRHFVAFEALPEPSRKVEANGLQ